MKKVLAGMLFMTLPARADEPMLTEVTCVSSADGSEQAALFHAPTDTGTPVPLVVALHPWSSDYRIDTHADIARWCVANGWAYIQPNFRGPNKRPEATGSDLVVSDIVDAVEFAKRAARIDAGSVYLVGTSGGGYTALLMAGRRPELWAGVSAWVPIADLAAWYGECRRANRGYWRDLAASCGGAPGDSPEVDRQYAERSPITHLRNATGVTLHIHAGIRDGHAGSVPISHALRAFNEVARKADRVSVDDIRFMVEHAAVPERLRREIPDPSYGTKKPLFRRTSGNATVTLFDGDHELVPEAALAWIREVHRARANGPADSR